MSDFRSRAKFSIANSSRHIQKGRPERIAPVGSRLRAHALRQGQCILDMHAEVADRAVNLSFAALQPDGA